MDARARRWTRAALARLGLIPLARRAARMVRAPGVPTVRPTVLRVVAHDPQAHTQGLAYADGELYESTGRIDASTLRRLDVESGAVRQLLSVPDVWAEGIALAGGELVQLTYTEGRALRYRRPGLEPAGSYAYDGDGWGLAATRDGFVMSDGSAVLQLRDGRFEPRAKVRVTLAGRPLDGLNDVEFVDGRIYACALWHTDIYEIDMHSGAVDRVIDCTELVARSRRGNYRDVLNGIAFAPDRGTFFITGKHWPSLFEVRLPR
jgi:glutamine cyclotransferase